MKNLLLASTALVLSAGLAHAQAVTISGQGRMGIGGTDAGAGWTWAQENRLQLNFTAAVQADHGLTFGAYTRVRITNGGTGIDPIFPASQRRGGIFSGSRVWVETNGFRLTFGNVDGAFRGAGTSHGYAGGCGVGYEEGQQCGDSVGLLGVTQGFQSNPSATATGGGSTARVRMDYTMGSTRVSLSNDSSTATGGAGVIAGSTELGVRTSFDAFDVAFGYTNGGTAMGDSYALSGHYNGGSWGVGLIVARVATGAATSVTTYALSGNVALGGGDLYAYVGTAPSGLTTVNAYGLNYGYGLGGGATLVAGAERVGATTTASVGVKFNF